MVAAFGRSLKKAAAVGRRRGRWRQARLGSSRASFEPARDTFFQAGACIERCFRLCSYVIQMSLIFEGPFGSSTGPFEPGMVDLGGRIWERILVSVGLLHPRIPRDPKLTFSYPGLVSKSFISYPFISGAHNRAHNHAHSCAHTCAYNGTKKPALSQQHTPTARAILKMDSRKRTHRRTHTESTYRHTDAHAHKADLCA